MMWCALLVAVQASTTLGEDSLAGNHPVSKVVSLLEDMQQQLHKEADEDEEVYEKVSCWCTTNSKDKTASISAAEARILELEAAIENHSANSARLNSELKNLAAEIAANEEALSKAQALRTKELAEFNEEEKDLLGSIGGLKSAITVLKKHQSFAQVPEMTAMEMVATVHEVLNKHMDMVNSIVTPSQRKEVLAYLQAAPGMGNSYNSQSGAIFGIMEQMKETFETNLANSQSEEKQSQEAFNELKAAKQAEIAAGQALTGRKQQELANEDDANAQAKEDLEDTRNSLSADQKFLMNLQETCKNTDAEYEQRRADRQEEIVAVGKALEILSSDDARSQFSKTFNFVQVAQKDARSEAVDVLQAAAKKLGNPKLSALATKAKLDAFTKVIGNIDEMIADLKKQMADDVKHKDFCNGAIRENEKAQTLKARDIDEHNANLDSLANHITQLKRSIAKLTGEVEEMQVQLKRAGEDREIENQDFQHTVEDQRATKELLNNAKGVLEGVYKKKDEGYAALQADPVGPPAPKGFTEYKKQGGAGGVLGMLEQIIAETTKLETEAINAEHDAQKGYETFVKDTNKSMNEKNRAITDQTADKAQAEKDHTATASNLEAAEKEQKENQDESAALHSQCDFTLQNFDVRQAALTQELEALGQAKSILKGSKFTAFLERK
jgi:hypothetical protein